MNIINRNKTSGISPFDPDVFTNVVFVVAETNEQEDNNESVEPNHLSSTVSVTIENRMPNTAVMDPSLQALRYADKKIFTISFFLKYSNRYDASFR